MLGTCAPDDARELACRRPMRCSGSLLPPHAKVSDAPARGRCARTHRLRPPAIPILTGATTAPTGAMAASRACAGLTQRRVATNRAIGRGLTFARSCCAGWALTSADPSQHPCPQALHMTCGGEAGQRARALGSRVLGKACWWINILSASAALATLGYGSRHAASTATAARPRSALARAARSGHAHLSTRCA